MLSLDIGMGSAEATGEDATKGYKQADWRKEEAGFEPWQVQANWFHVPGEVIGIDLRDTHKPEVVCDAQNLPFRGEAFDIMTASELLEHLPCALCALASWHRCLKPKGEVYVTVPNGVWLPVVVQIARMKETSEHPEHFNTWHHRKLQQLFEMSGFKVVRIGFFTRYVQAGRMPWLAYKFRKLRPSVLEMNIMMKAMKA